MLGILGAAAGAVAALIVLVILGSVGSGAVVDRAVPAGGCAIQPAEPEPSETPTVTLDAEQLAAARLIVGTGKGLGVAERGTAIALTVAMTESALDPTAAHGRAVGLFLQSGLAYAGIDRTDPIAAARAFYALLSVRVPEYRDTALPLAVAAATAQAGGAGIAAYQRWEQWALSLAASLYGDGTSSPSATVTCRPGGGPGPNPVPVDGLAVHVPLGEGRTAVLPFPNQIALTAAVAALSYLGTPYAWGGGNTNGPTTGIRDGGIADRYGDYRLVGFDCSGLMHYAYAQAGVTLPRQSRTQQHAGTTVAWRSAKPGDLLFWGDPVHHVAMYLGVAEGQHLMIEAPRSGAVVAVSPVRTGDDFIQRATRPY